MTDRPAAPAPGTPAPGSPGPVPRWVTVLAIINIVWIVVCLLMLLSGTFLALFGFFLLPQVFFLMALPVPFLLVSVAAIVLAVVLAFWRGRAGERLRSFWIYGTVILPAVLAIGPLSTLIFVGTR